MAGSQASIRTLPTNEQEFIALFVFSPYVVIQCLSGLFRNLKSNWMASFLLPDSCTINFVAPRRNVFYADAYNVTASKLAVYGEIK